MVRPLWIPWRWWRRFAQLASLALFLWLFRRTEFTGDNLLPGGENILFRLDPLAAAAAMFAGRQFIWLFWPALVLLLLTLIIGRFFCGWICPLGTFLDIFHRLLRPITARTNRLFAKLSPKTSQPARKSFAKTISYALLLAVLVAAVFQFQLVGFVDPFSLSVRAMTVWIDPALFRAADAVLAHFSEGWVAETLAPFVKKHVLPFRPMLFELAGVSAMLLATIFALEFVARRFWCRFLCPAGAFFALFSRRTLIKRSPVRVCKSCGHCAAICRMGALDPAVGVSPPDCTLCMDCVDLCPKSIVSFGLAKKTAKSRPQPVDLSRRGILTGLAAGAAIPATALAARLGKERQIPPNLIRPPGAEDEKKFLDLCVRCGECMKVCPTNVLQPTLLESGIEGVFSPRVANRYIFEQSYCEYTCTLCGQVCPSGAIPRLTEDEKHARPMGKAYFDHKLCLPWAENTPCIRCEEMCPVPDKAIKILRTFTIKDKDGKEVEIQQPYVDRDLCIGCGICECNCTVEGTPAIRVQRPEAPDPGTEFLLPK